jgi:hypothetical protein
MATPSVATGPVTAEGKETVSRNGLTHGLTSRKHILLHGESQEEFDARQLQLIHQWEPATRKEEETVKRIAAAEWRLTRGENLETDCFNEVMDPANPNFSEAFDKCQEKLAKITRYLGSLRSEYNKAIALIMRLQESRRRNQRNDAIAEVKSWDAEFESSMANTEAVLDEIHERVQNKANSVPEAPPEPQAPPPPVQTPVPARKPTPAWLKKPPKMRF